MPIKVRMAVNTRPIPTVRCTFRGNAQWCKITQTPRHEMNNRSDLNDRSPFFMARVEQILG